MADIVKAVGIFGSTGETGLHVTRYALDRGYSVYALARTPSTLKLPELSDEARSRLHVVQGNIYDDAAVEEVVSRSDVIIETLGVPVNRPTTLKQDGTRAILKAMQKLKKNTFIAVTSAILREPGLKELPWMMRPMVDFMMNHIAADLRAQEDLILAESNWLDFTIFEPPQLIPTAPTGKAVVSPAKPPPGTNQVPFADLAQAMLDAAITKSHNREIVYINTTQKMPLKWKDTIKQRTLLLDNLLTKVLVPGIKAVAITAAVALAYEFGKDQLQKSRK